MSLTLYGYWRSSAAWRVRLALNLKSLPYDYVPVNLVRNGGEQHASDYRLHSPDGLVPSLCHDDWSISQSSAICEYLEAQWPQPALLPADPRLAAQVRSFCAAVSCDIHPLNNLRVLNYLKDTLDVNEQDKLAWYTHWIALGLQALEARLANRHSTYAYAELPGLAECFLIPQLYNARRFNCPLEPYPTLVRIDALCANHPAFISAHPDQQTDKPHD